MQDQRRVAHPAEAVVPVAHAADVLGQRGGRRGDDAAGRRVGERLQRDRGCAGPGSRCWPRSRASARDHSSHQRVVSAVAATPSTATGLLLVRRVPGEHERDLVARLAGRTRRRWSGRGRASAVPATRWTASGPAIAVSPPSLGAPHPRDHAAEVEAQDELHRTLTRPSRQRATRTMSGASSRIGIESTTCRTPSAVWKSVSSTSVPCAVAPLGTPHVVCRGEQPAPVRLVAEQRGEAGGRVEARQAEPVDRAVVADERRRLGVADQRVVLDPQRHRVRCARNPAARLRRRAFEWRLCRPQAVEVARGNALVLRSCGAATASYR